MAKQRFPRWSTLWQWIAAQFPSRSSKHSTSRQSNSGGLLSLLSQGFRKSDRFFRSQRDISSLSHNATGDTGEEIAARFLKQLGYRILEKQYRVRGGEIDLIALDGDTIVFVEVKSWREKSSRSTKSMHGSRSTSREIVDPAEAVDQRKQQRLTRAALMYLKRKRWLDRSIRFDVISVRWPAADAPLDGRDEPIIRHYLHAFEATNAGDARF